MQHVRDDVREEQQRREVRARVLCMRWAGSGAESAGAFAVRSVQGHRQADRSARELEPGKHCRRQAEQGGPCQGRQARGQRRR
eukprot:143878-Hanusia_phi.AAC.1